MNPSETTKNATADALVAKLWNFCNLLRDDGTDPLALDRYGRGKLTSQ